MNENANFTRKKNFGALKRAEFLINGVYIFPQYPPSI